MVGLAFGLVSRVWKNGGAVQSENDVWFQKKYLTLFRKKKSQR